MLTFNLGRSSRNCEGVSRRDALRVGALSFGGLSLGDLLRTEAAAKPAGASVKKKSVVCFWLDGGPTQHETFDPKPLAPTEYKGPFSAVRTKADGVQFCELFSKTAQVMDKLSVVRSVHHNNGDHFAAAHWMWTGYYGSTAANLDQMYPGIGAVLSKVKGPNNPGMPAAVSIPYAMTVGRRPGYQGGAFLGVANNPFETGADPNNANFQVQNVKLPGGVSQERAKERKSLVSRLDRVRRDVDASGLMEGIDRFNQQAFDMVTGQEAAKAFDIKQEKDSLRDEYGRNTVGQGALLARRLVEAGVTFVTIHSGGWDNHSTIGPAMKNHAARLDPAIAALTNDLDQRGLLDDTIVLVMGEFGRTPKVNGSAGRDHWGNVMSVLIGGGGLKPGIAVGESDEKGASPSKRPVKPAHVLHTIYKQFGVDPSMTHLNRAGRPIHILGEGEPIAELL